MELDSIPFNTVAGVAITWSRANDCFNYFLHHPPPPVDNIHALRKMKFRSAKLHFVSSKVTLNSSKILKESAATHRTHAVIRTVRLAQMV